MAEIITYVPELKTDFINLNKAWLTALFTIESHDQEVFDKVEELIIQLGGQIFFCVNNTKVMGTVAMQYVKEGVFELTKMAVDKNYQGGGYSKLLMSACINFAIEKKARKIVLFSNRKLAAALSLYKKFGFKEVPIEKNEYARADIQMELSLDNLNVWNVIPLSDYELHMSNESVGQLKLLDDLTKNCLNKLQPKTALFLGVAGGNGLDHIDNTITTKVMGIDINETYLEATKKRYSAKISDLQLYNIDITKNKEELIKADFVWAALIMEYTGIEKCFEFIENNINVGGRLIVSIQSNNGIQSVSSTGVESIKIAGKLFNLVEYSELLEKAKHFGYELETFEENFLPNGKSIKTYNFKKV